MLKKFTAPRPASSSFLPARQLKSQPAPPLIVLFWVVSFFGHQPAAEDSHQCISTEQGNKLRTEDG
jgi:hypothetical protein